MPKKISTNKKGMSPRQMTLKRLAREDLFVQEYFKDFNGTLAAERVGYAARSAGVTANRLLKNTRIQQLIADRRKELERVAHMTQEEWVRRMEALSRASLKQVASWTQANEAADAHLQIKSSEDMTDEEAWLLNEVTLTKGKYGNSIGVKLNSKLSALAELGKALGYYPEKVRDGDTVNNQININLHKANDPMDFSALSGQEKIQLKALLEKMAGPKVIGHGKGEYS